MIASLDMHLWDLEKMSYWGWKSGDDYLIAPGKEPGLHGGDFTLLGEDEGIRIQIKIQWGLEMEGGDVFHNNVYVLDVTVLYI